MEDNRMKFFGLANMPASLPLARALSFGLIAIAAAGIGTGPAVAENPDITSRRASERKDFSNEEAGQDFCGQQSRA
jgi:hypothetical protein